MSFEGKTYLYNVMLAFFLLFSLVIQVSAQEVKPEPSAVAQSQRDVKREVVAEEVEQLKSQLKELQSLVEQQRRALEEIQRRLEERGEAARKIVPASLSKTEETSVGSSDVQATANMVTQGQSAPSAGQPVAQSSKNTSSAGQQLSQEKPLPIVGWGRDHAFIRSPDGAFETQIGGYGQLDFRGYQSGNHIPNSFFLRRARIALEGKLDRYFDFRIEGDFADVITPLRDLYVNIHRIDEFQLRFGQFRVPYSQEEMRSDNNQDFVERSLVNNLVPSRSPGVGALGSLNKGVFEYQVGAWNGKGLLAANSTGTPETALRLRFNPWKHGGNFWAKGFLFGGAFTQGRSGPGTLSVRGLTESRSSIFFVPDTTSGKYIRANGEFTWMLGPAAIRAEYDQTNQNRDNLGLNGGNLPGVVAKGYTAQVTYLLTREEKPETTTVTPKSNLFADSNGRQGLGAWELKVRYANLQISDATAKSNRAGTLYFGTNWYMNRYVRYMLDLGFERFKDPARSPQPGDKNFFVILSRVQVAF